MRRYLILLCLLLSMQGYGQVNYVLNGGFEQYSQCPWRWNQIRLADYWQPIDTTDTQGFGPLCSPEYCNVCATDFFVSVPEGTGYYHYPRSGGGMMESLFYVDSLAPGPPYYRDYSQGKLRTYLTPGKSYCVTFYVTLTQISQYAVNKMGAYLDNGAIDEGRDSAGCASPIPYVHPQVFSSAIINDTLNWVKVQGAIIGSGTERFITIGNFFPRDQTDTINLHPDYGVGGGAGYLIDDVSIIASDAVANAGPTTLIGNGDTVHIGNWEDGLPCTWYIQGSSTPIGYGGGLYVHPTTTTNYVVELDLCGNVTRDTMTVVVVPAAVPGTGTMRQPITTYPNPATSQLHIDHAAGCAATVTDMAGREQGSYKLTGDKETIDVSLLPTGMYLLQITDNTTGLKTVAKLQKE